MNKLTFEPQKELTLSLVADIVVLETHFDRTSERYHNGEADQTIFIEASRIPHVIEFLHAAIVQLEKEGYRL
jgi:hypothetical protein